MRYILTLILTAILSATPGGAAHARDAGVTWEWFRTSDRVCVEDHSGRPVSLDRAIRRWNSAGAHLFRKANCGTWQDNRYRIRIYDHTKRHSTRAGQYNTTQFWSETQAATGRVDLNNWSRTRKYRPCLRQWAMTHELGHALGLGHNQLRSVMNGTWNASNCGTLTDYDRLDLRRL